MIDNFILLALPTSKRYETVPASISVALAVSVTAVPSFCGDGTDAVRWTTGVAIALLLSEMPAARTHAGMKDVLSEQDFISPPPVLTMAGPSRLSSTVVQV
jgi:hypothetical protein